MDPALFGRILCSKFVIVNFDVALQEKFFANIYYKDLQDKLALCIGYKATQDNVEQCPLCNEKIVGSKTFETLFRLHFVVI